MKPIAIAFALIIVSVFPSRALTLDQRADSAYAADDFTAAAALYSQMIDSLGTSPRLLYNLGNCYYRLGKPGKAIICYERALRINPGFSDARANLEFVNSRIYDKQGERGSFLSNTFDRAATVASANTLAWSALVIFLIALGAVALYYFSPVVAVRKCGFFGAILLFMIFAATITLTIRGYDIARDNDAAIITSPSALLSTSPREPKDRREEAMLLHEGTKVVILDSITAGADTTGLKWLDVQVDNNHRAWIKSSDIERI